jgi:hypothetical protein
MDFKTAIERTRQQLLHNAKVVDAGHWQGITTEGKPDLLTKEVLNVYFLVEMPQYVHGDGMLHQLRHQIKPNLPWADDHFVERVSRVPSNPGEQYKNWPWWRNQPGAFAKEDSRIFTHTYQERYWPKEAGNYGATKSTPIGLYPRKDVVTVRGIRYPYGDLDDLVSLLLRQPYTRQAWLPIFFPEDTGAVHGGRVPCTLGYQFMLRDGKLDMWYIIRSCDFVRHFRDDLYLSARLLLWMIDELVNRELRSNTEQLWVDVEPGNFHFHCFSMHYHRGDEHLVRAQ